MAWSEVQVPALNADLLLLVAAVVLLRFVGPHNSAMALGSSKSSWLCVGFACDAVA